MDIKKIIKEEMDDFDWVREIDPTINYVTDIKYFLNIPFKLYDRKTRVVELDTGVLDGIYWIEEHEESPKRYNICWNDPWSKTKGCIDYNVKEIVEYFSANGLYPWLWKFGDQK
jgi:hypothetical protein